VINKKNVVRVASNFMRSSTGFCICTYFKVTGQVFWFSGCDLVNYYWGHGSIGVQKKQGD
jgi:hypothetical protein